MKNLAVQIWEDRGVDWHENSPQSQLVHFLHVWLLVGKSFARNRCPARAAALAYSTLLALIPMLAVMASIGIIFLKSDGEKTIRALIDQTVAYVAPALNLEVKTPEESATGGREVVVAKIMDFINNTSSGTLGLTSSLALIFVAIQMLRTIELTFNDIWGVTQGRSWARCIIQYWGAVTLGPLAILTAMAVSSTPHFSKAFSFINHFPILSAGLFSVIPFFILGVAFMLVYLLMPNTRVQFGAALTGGFVAAFLWELNIQLNSLYLSRVVSYSQVYGSLGLVPLFLLGIFLSWLFLLFGAQVAYACQNRQAYLQEKVAESVNQAGREQVAIHLMLLIGGRFVDGHQPPTASEMSRDLALPTRLVAQVLRILALHRLVVEVAGMESAFSPGRPLAQITLGQILQAMRHGNGEELPPCHLVADARIEAVLTRLGTGTPGSAESVTLQALLTSTP